jgi:chemotaxis protein MotB
MSVILAWSKGGNQDVARTAQNDAAVEEDDPRLTARKAIRDDPTTRLAKEAMSLNMGKTGLPTGAALVNPEAAPKPISSLPPGQSPATAGRKE